MGTASSSRVSNSRRVPEYSRGADYQDNATTVALHDKTTLFRLALLYSSTETNF